MLKSGTATAIKRYFDTDGTPAESLYSDNFWRSSSIDRSGNSASSNNLHNIGTSDNTYPFPISDHYPDDNYYNASFPHTTGVGNE